MGFGGGACEKMASKGGHPQKNELDCQGRRIKKTIWKLF